MEAEGDDKGYLLDTDRISKLLNQMHGWPTPCTGGKHYRRLYQHAEDMLVEILDLQADVKRIEAERDRLRLHCIRAGLDGYQVAK